jgi:hypothetical protein
MCDNLSFGVNMRGTMKRILEITAVIVIAVLLGTPGAAYGQTACGGCNLEEPQNPCVLGCPVGDPNNCGPCNYTPWGCSYVTGGCGEFAFLAPVLAGGIPVSIIDDRTQFTHVVQRALVGRDGRDFVLRLCGGMIAVHVTTPAAPQRAAVD